MKKQPSRKSDPASALRMAALQYPEVEEGIACQGTSLEKRTIKVRNKAFLFLGQADAMLKLLESLPQATEMAASDPSRFKVGGKGWVTVEFDGVASLPLDVLVRWVGESYRLFAPKQLVTSLQTHATQAMRMSTSNMKGGQKSKSNRG